MDIDEAHELYQQFQKVDAAAKQKQVNGKWWPVKIMISSSLT